jgi:hypothetical protein
VLHTANGTFNYNDDDNGDETSRQHVNIKTIALTTFIEQQSKCDFILICFQDFFSCLF